MKSPPPLYHGTEADFTEFRDGLTWFTPDREETFHQYRSDFARPWFIFRVALRLERVADLADDAVRAVLAGAGFDPDQTGQLSECSREVVPLLERHGYDGLSAWMGDVRHYAAFHPHQISVEHREELPAST